MHCNNLPPAACLLGRRLVAKHDMGAVADADGGDDRVIPMISPILSRSEMSGQHRRHEAGFQ